MLGQVLLTKRMGKTRVIAETGAGQHGVATATACALLGLECVVYMGEEDTRRQALNVSRMRMLGATVVPVTAGTKTLKDAMNEAFRDWVTTVDNTHYCIGSVGGPHPFPMMVRDFQRVIGVEARQQVLEPAGRLPDAVVACVGGGSNAIGVFHAFIPDAGVRLIGCEAGGDGDGRPERSRRDADPGQPRACCTACAPTCCRTPRARPSTRTRSRPGLDYPGVGPEHSWLKDTGRAEYRSVSDAEAMEGFAALCKTEGIIPALESAHALAGAMQARPRARPGRADPGQPVRPRRQGRGHRVRLLRRLRGEIEPAAMSTVSTAFEKAAAEDRAALVGYLPAGFPDKQTAIRAALAMAEAGRRRHRGRPALLRPADGRPGHRRRRPPRARGRHQDRGRLRHRARRSPTPAPPRWS